MTYNRKRIYPTFIHFNSIFVIICVGKRVFFKMFIVVCEEVSLNRSVAAYFVITLS